MYRLKGQQLASSGKNLRAGVAGLLTACGVLAALSPGQLAAADAPPTNAVSNVGFTAYKINNVNNPNLTLTRGQTYVFNVTASGHPFWIKTVATTGTGNAYNNGVSNNGLQSGTLTFTVPADAPNTLFYICQFHSAMKGTLNIIDAAPAAPIVRILAIDVGQSVVVKSTGVTGWNAVPEYSTDLPPTAWSAVDPFTNTFADGTNTTSFAPITGSNVFIRIRNSRN